MNGKPRVNFAIVPRIGFFNNGEVEKAQSSFGISSYTALLSISPTGPLGMIGLEHRGNMAKRCANSRKPTA